MLQITEIEQILLLYMVSMDFNFIGLTGLAKLTIWLH